MIAKPPSDGATPTTQPTTRVLRPMRSSHWRLGRWLWAAPIVALLWYLLAGLTPPVSGQTGAAPLEPGDVGHGLSIYLDRCASCHGVQGGGDGEMASQAIRPPTALADPAFLSQAVPAAMSEVIRNGRMENGMPPFGEASSNPLSEQDRADVVAALYALSTRASDLNAGQSLVAAHDLLSPLSNVDWYNTSDAAAAASLSDTGLSADEVAAAVSFGRMQALDYYIPEASLSGQVVNGSSGQPVGGIPIMLQVFERFDPIQTITSTVAADGSYIFPLEQVAPDWVYFATVQYAGLDYPSTFARFERSAPIQTAPLTVYDTTTDPDVVNLSQVHLILEFNGDMLTVNEFYGFGTRQPYVFLGASGNPDDGTVSVTLPPNAQNVSIMRSIAGASNFTPATNLRQDGDNLTDVTSIAPGANTLGLLVRYDLPYQDGIRITHPLNYTPGQVSLIMPEAGVSLGDVGNWTALGSQSFQGGTFLNYQAAASDVVDVQLKGKPRLVVNTSGSLVAQRNQSSELLIGAALLLGVAAVAVIQMRRWQQTPPPDPDALLDELAALDDAYAEGALTDKQYTAERQRLKQALFELWGSGGNA